MAVIAVWKCDRDGSMFEDKKLADEHDKMLELAEGIMHLIDVNIEGVSEQTAEEIGLLLAKNRDLLLKALKGKPELLMAETAASPETPSTTEDAGRNANAHEPSDINSKMKAANRTSQPPATAKKAAV